MRILLLLSVVLLFACRESSSPEQPAALTDRSYQEPHRNQIHFSPDSMWMNDPNGMVYYAGEYHLFYQYYPDSTVWGPMHWGHAISRDLVHWEHLPIALYPDELGYIFSGSAVIDWNNTTGFGDGKTPPMVAIFTHHDIEGERSGAIDFQYQSIAYSLDHGRSWTKYAGNPVIPNPGIKDFRDPKVIWDHNSQQWVMVLAAWDQLKIYGSPDLKHWTHLSDFGREWGSPAGVWECPDLFPITIEGSQEQRWLLLVSVQDGSPNGGTGAQYFVGNFDGKNFQLSDDFVEAVRPAEVLEEQSINRGEKAAWVDYGRDNYAGVTWSDIPDNDRRRLFMGWMSNWQYAQQVPSQRWRSAMTLPRELSLIRTSAGPRLAARPVAELREIRPWKVNRPLPKTAGAIIQHPATPSEWFVRFDPAQLEGAEAVVIAFSNPAGELVEVGYDLTSKQFFSDRRQTKLADFHPEFAKQIHYAARAEDVPDYVEMQVFFDLSAIELFGDNGRTVLTDIYFAAEPLEQAKLYVKGGDITTLETYHYPLNSIWE